MLLLPTNFQASTVSGARRRAASAWIAEENPFSQNNPTSDIFESSFYPDPNTQENRKHLYSVDNEVVNDLIRHTRDYVKKIGRITDYP